MTVTYYVQFSDGGAKFPVSKKFAIALDAHLKTGEAHATTALAEIAKHPKLTDPALPYHDRVKLVQDYVSRVKIIIQKAFSKTATATMAKPTAGAATTAE